jgi:hypothetical protein
MSRDLNRELLVQVVAAIFEEAAFIFTEEASTPPAWDADELLAVSLQFKGERVGHFGITTTMVFANELAANLLGQDDAGDITAGRDALAELLNIAAGPLVAQLFGAASLTSIGVPEVVAVDNARMAQAPSLAEACLLTEEGGRIDIYAYFEGE